MLPKPQSVYSKQHLPKEDEGEVKKEEEEEEGGKQGEVNYNRIQSIPKRESKIRNLKKI